MPPGKYKVPQRWSVAETTFAATEISRALGTPLLVARCLVNRGILTPEAAEPFLAPRLKQLSDPFLLPDMDAAVAALLEAHRRGEAVVVFGDYDVDGVTSTAILMETLAFFGWKVSAFLPHRIDDGYGLNLEAAQRALGQANAKFLLAVDCGSTAFETIAALNAAGNTVVVLDHHQISSPAPAARAMVNPQRGGRFTELCSAGLAFKLAHALTKRLRDLKWPAAENFDVRTLLDFVALGTIADLVPLQGENRILVSAGLKRLAETPRPGLIALKKVAGLRDCGVHEVGFQLGPRLNAAGRLEHAMEALDLLQASTMQRAEEIARGLDERNQSRQRLEQKIADECLEVVRGNFNPETHYVIVEGNKAWHVGVVGIVASRVQREFHRPAIIVGSDGAAFRGSGRSIEGFDLAAGLRECSHLLDRHGGHAMAAGLSVKLENLPLLRERINELARARLDATALQRTVRLDAEVKFSELTFAVVNALENLGPFGMGNPAPQIMIRGARLTGEVKRMGDLGKHARFRVGDGTGFYDAVWWGAGELPPGPMDLAVAPQLNYFNGTTSVQLKVVDVRPSGKIAGTS
jgi:single-stranded-DNA-specific exonuclease